MQKLSALTVFMNKIHVQHPVSNLKSDFNSNLETTLNHLYVSTSINFKCRKTIEEIKCPITAKIQVNWNMIILLHDM